MARENFTLWDSTEISGEKNSVYVYVKGNRQNLVFSLYVGNKKDSINLGITIF